MAGIAFDTLAFANKLKKAGMNEKIADVQAEETAKILNELTTNQLVTRQDLKTELTELKIDMYAFIVKSSTFIVGILGGLQTLFHFIK